MNEHRELNGLEVTLIDVMGDDRRVVDAARVSFHKVAENYLVEQNNRLIKYLAKHNHFTPFTHPMITLREKVPIFVARQRFKHMVGFTYNEVSRRYVDDTPEFHVPDVWRSRPEGSVKQGSGTKEVTNLNWSEGHKTQIRLEYADLINQVKELYERMVADGVAPEQARMVLPQSMYTEYFCTGSLYAFARAYKLRSEESSQLEIQELAKQWDHIIRPLFPVSWSALVD